MSYLVGTHMTQLQLQIVGITTHVPPSWQGRVSAVARRRQSGALWPLHRPQPSTAATPSTIWRRLVASSRAACEAGDLRPASSWGWWAAPTDVEVRHGRCGRAEQPAIGKRVRARMLCLERSFVPHGENSEPGSAVLRTSRAHSERGCRAFAAPPSAVATHDRRVTFRDGCTLAVLQARANSRSFGLRAGRELASLTVCSPCRCRSPRRPRALAPPQACAGRAVTMLGACPSRRPRKLAASSCSVFPRHRSQTQAKSGCSPSILNL
jgi:hypothetical protein